MGESWNFWRARSRLYQNEILKEDMRWQYFSSSTRCAHTFFETDWPRVGGAFPVGSCLEKIWNIKTNSSRSTKLTQRKLLCKDYRCFFFLHPHEQIVNERRFIENFWQVWTIRIWYSNQSRQTTNLLHTLAPLQIQNFKRPLGLSTASDSELCFVRRTLARSAFHGFPSGFKRCKSV